MNGYIYTHHIRIDWTTAAAHTHTRTHISTACQYFSTLHMYVCMYVYAEKCKSRTRFRISYTIVGFALSVSLSSSLPPSTLKTHTHTFRLRIFEKKTCASMSARRKFIRKRYKAIKNQKVHKKK